MSDTFNAKAARAMRSAFESGKTGALISEVGSCKRLVFFECGELVGSRSNVPQERLGEIMVREERITAAELDHAVGYIRSGRKLGQILVELGYLGSGEIERFVRLQIFDIACAILMSLPDRLVFSEQMAVEAVTLSPVSIGDVFLDAVNRLEDVGLYRQNVLIEDYVLEQTDDALAVASGMDLSEDQGALLDLVDGKNSVHEILAASPLGEEEAVRTLIAHHQAGVVRLKERKVNANAPAGPRPTPKDPAPDPFEKELIELYNDVQCQNHWQVLGLERGAQFSQIDAAYKKRTHRLDPDNWQHIPDADFQEKLAFVRARMKEAFITLSSQTSTNVYEQLEERDSQYQESKERWEAITPTPDEVVLEEWELGRDAEGAARLFKRAKHAMKERDYWNAIELCRKAIELDENNEPERYHLLGRALAENPRWRQDAEQNLKIAHKLEPWEPKYLVSLGQLYQKEGLTERAERVFEQVRTLDPDYVIPDSPAANRPKKLAEPGEKIAG